MKPLVEAVAAGSRTSTVFEFSTTAICGKTQFSFSELHLGANPSEKDIYDALNLDMDAVLTTLLYDCPYDLYWYDKTAGTSYSFSVALNKGASTVILGTTMTYWLPVAADYSAGQYTVSSTLPDRVNNAVTRVNNILEAHKGENDTAKLTSYKSEICNLVSYNMDVFSCPANYNYGDPWQLVWVFDGDTSTNVVCEGYSKAFQYLADRSSFSSGKVKVIHVTGTMNDSSNSIGHMWNIVTLSDGLNYLADITNCDTGMVGSPNRLFLARCQEGDVTNGFLFKFDQIRLTYYYDAETRRSFPESRLAIASESAEPPVSVYDVSCTAEPAAGGAVSATPPYGITGRLVTLTAAPNPGFRFKEWQVVSGGVTITENQFTIGTENVEIKGIFELISGEDPGTPGGETPGGDPGTPGGDTPGGETPGSEKPEADPPASLPASFKDDSGLYTIFTGGETATAAWKPADKKASKLSVPASVNINGTMIPVTAIADNACKGMKNLTSLKLPNSIASIGKNAFASCSKLKSLKLGSGLVSIGAGAFKGCTSLGSVTIPAKVTSIGKDAFNGCKALGKITIKSALLTKKGIGKNSFKNIKPTAVFKVPGKARKNYETWLVKTGKAPKTAQFK